MTDGDTHPSADEKLLAARLRAAAELDAGCVRLLRRITELTASGADRSSPEVVALTSRLDDAQRELHAVRKELFALRAQAERSRR